MGFFSKIFRRHKSPHNDHLKSPRGDAGGGAAGATPSGGGGGGGFGRLRGRRINSNATPTDRDSPTELVLPDDHPQANASSAPSSSAGAALLPGGGGGRFRRGPDLSEGSQRVNAIKSPRSDETASSGQSGGPTRNNGGGTAASAAWAAGGTGAQQPWPSSSRPLSSSSTGPIDLDASDLESLTPSRGDDSGSGGGGKRAAPPRLSSQRLEEFEKQNQQGHSYNHHHAPVFTMEDSSRIRFSAGHLNHHNYLPDHNQHHPRSPSSEEDESSSFNLSTDAEDTDYENLKRRGVLPPMDTSTYSGQYNTDGETSTSVFPNLPTDDEATVTVADREEQLQQQHALRHVQRLGGGGGMGSGPGGDALSLSNKASNDSSSIDAMAWAKDQFGPESFLPSSYHSKASTSSSAPNGTASGGGSNSLQRRSFTTPKKAFDDDQDDFANFADFNNITFPSDPGWDVAAATTTTSQPVPPVPTTTAPAAAAPQQQQPPPPPQQSHVSHIRAVFEEKSASPPQSARASSATKPSAVAATPLQQPPPASSSAVPPPSSSSAVYTDTSLSELLAQAKSKSTSRHLRRSGHSVNSAPVSSGTTLSAAYLRQHHNLRPRAADGVAARLSLETGSAGLGGGGTAGGATASVSDIIHSLEAANANRHHSTAAVATSASASGLGAAGRMRPSSRAGGTVPLGGGDLDALSVHSRDNASVRSAKERLRRRREHRTHRGAGSDSSESDENGSESWLMDEVTGALGPRGIAPDLESLSGRSNRSRSSGGGRSHKSHKSHRSHRSSRRSSNRRHKSSSGDSVSSHGSRRSRSSRHSRSSRYSHRSTRSYLSQMSEQSRSVANDLLRLEMQLAMVGSGAGGSSAANGSLIPDDATKRSAHTASSRHSSRATRGTSSRRAAAAAARRTRMTIVAPPGKLGIILANKADSRGTVVSGVRTSSVMAEQISPGDRIVAIDGEDVSLMTVSEITTIMTRKADFERTLTVLTNPRHTDPGSPRSADYDYIYK